MAKKVLVACGTGAATSTVVAAKVKSALAQRGVTVDVAQCKLAELASSVPQTRPDVIVVTGVSAQTEVAGVPVVRGFAFLTGVGIDAVMTQLLQHLQGKE